MTNRKFAEGLTACLALVLVMFAVLWLLNRGHSRPEGVAENWLTAISDTTRKGVEADATKRADKIGAPELAIHVLWPHAEDINRKAGFDDIEVGKAKRSEDGATADVAFRVHALRPDDKTVDIEGVIRLERQDDAWHVTDLRQVNPVEAGVPALPSDGGPPPSSAPMTLWLGALVGAAIIGVITTALVQSAGQPTTAAATA
jgi:hypothetical protein